MLSEGPEDRSRSTPTLKMLPHFSLKTTKRAAGRGHSTPGSASLRPALRMTAVAAALMLACVALLCAGCNQNAKPLSRRSESKAAAGSYTSVDPATAGTIRGTIHFSGQPPAPVPIDMDLDPACSLAGVGPNMSEQYVVHNGGLANVYIYVKQGLEGKKFPVPSAPAVLDQKGCRYVPHVLALMAGQKLEVRNEDSTMHNVHPAPAVDGNDQSNVSQAPKGQPVERTFNAPETMILVKCNQHPWMKSFVNVAANPFFAVSDADGTFEIAGLPPGTYTIAAVHEKSGEQDETITVSPKQAATANFTFTAQ
jgi:plastocyanin